MIICKPTECSTDQYNVPLDVNGWMVKSDEGLVGQSNEQIRKERHLDYCNCEYLWCPEATGPHQHTNYTTLRFQIVCSAYTPILTIPFVYSKWCNGHEGRTQMQMIRQDMQLRHVM